MTALTIILLSLLILAGGIYTVWYDIKYAWKTGAELSPKAEQLQTIIKRMERQLDFYESQIEIQKSIEKNTETAYNAAIKQVEHDSELNKYCMIVPQKMVLKHVRERDSLANKLFNTRNKIFNLELKKIKAIEKANTDAPVW